VGSLPSLIHHLAHGSGFVCDSDIIYGMSWTSTATRWARALQIRWHESDLIYLETHPLSPGVVPAIPETAKEGPGPTGTETGTVLPESDGGLSRGAVAGISIGALLGALVIVGAAFLLWRRRKKPSLVGSPEAGSTASAPLMQGPHMYGQMPVPQQPYYQMMAPAPQPYQNVSPGQEHRARMSDYSSTPPSTYYQPQPQMAQMAYLPPGVLPPAMPPASTSPPNVIPRTDSTAAEASAVAEPTELSGVPFPRGNQHNQIR